LNSVESLLGCNNNLIQNSQAVKKVCGHHCEKGCEIQGGSQEMAVMVE